VRRWRQASVYWKAGRRFFSNPPAAKARDDVREHTNHTLIFSFFFVLAVVALSRSFVKQDGEQKDVEKNDLPARSSLVNSIKRTISRLVRAVVG
jgi:hypothetical protein